MTTPSDTPVRARPESFRARELTASLTVRDLTKSLHWYGEVVGFTIGERFEKDGKLLGVEIKAGDAKFYLSQDDGKKGADRPLGQGFSLGFSTAQDLDALAKRIKDGGGTLTMEPTVMPWGEKMFRTVDPSGYSLSFSSLGA